MNELKKGSFKYKIFMKVIDILAAYDITITGDNLQIHHGGKSYSVEGNELPKCRGIFHRVK